MFIAATLASLLALSQNTASAIAADENRQLTACLEQIETDPEAAYEDGLRWLGNGSRPLARQCVALSLIALGRPEEGAAELEALASAPDAGSMEQRGLFLSQSGNAWLAAGYPRAAITTLTNALRLSPHDSTLLTDRAAAHLALESWQAAADDLDEALSINPGETGAYAMRARARLGLNRYDAALSDVQEARLTEPENVDLLVLRGEIREAKRLAE